MTAVQPSDEITPPSTVSSPADDLPPCPREGTARPYDPSYPPRLFGAILSSASNGLALIDSETLEFTEFNDRACAMHGYSREEFAGMTLADLSACMTSEQIRESHAAFCADPDPSGTVLVAHRHRDGRLLDVRADFRFEELNGRTYSVTFWTDVTEETAARDKLAEREKVFSLIVANTADGLVLIDIETLRFIEFNDVAPRDLGYTRAEFAELKLTDIVADSDEGDLRRQVETASKLHDGSFERRSRHIRSDGSIIDVAVRFRLSDLGGRKVAVASWSDITARLADERKLRESEQRFRTLVENSPDAIIRYDRSLSRVYVNPAYERLTHRPASDVLGVYVGDDDAVAEPEVYRAKLAQVFATATEQTIEYRLRSIDGSLRWTQVRIAPEISIDESGQRVVTHVLAIVRDIQELIDQREAVRRLAETDPLTGLPNRSYFNRSLADLIERCRLNNKRFALTVFDLDHFKDVNDGLGHGAGDRLLLMAADRLRDFLPEHAALARLGGDEFSICIDDFREPAQVRDLAERILRHLARPFVVEGRRIFVTASIGTAIYPADGDTTDALVASADAAMYDAKRKGRNNHQFYINELVKQASDRLSVTAALHAALRHNEFELHYQPQVAMRTGEVIGAEALIRWNHPVEGRIAPARFIPLAEETGLIVEIGRWALFEAAATAARWNDGRRKPIIVAVNLSTRQFLHHDLVATLREALAATGCDGRWLELEITESLLLDDHPAVQTALAGLRALGARIAIDDFGTGHSALGYLNRFPVDTLKVDRSFTSHLAEDPRKKELVRAFLAVARALGIGVIAEGVETTEQARLLEEFGCEVGQGYLFGRPEPAALIGRRLGLDPAPVRKARSA
jgi:diguanylate cyclase (GGDEF)-like protein/PAS domain S-box-containing protein